MTASPPLAPPIVYFGGKSTIAQRIVDLLPPHRHYVEPFAGSLAVLLAKPPTPMETVNDLDQNLMTFWRVLRDRPDELARVCALTPHSRSEHQAACDREGAPNDLERARRVWVLLTQGRGAMMRRTGWRYYADPSGATSMPDYLTAYVERMRGAAARLARVSLECRPALELIAKYGAHEDVLLFADPPYLGSTRSGGAQYGHEMRTEAEHRALADALRACAATVVLSGYDSPLYSHLYAGWDATRIATSSGNATVGAHARTEVLWSNRPLGPPRLDIEYPTGDRGD